MEPIHVRDVFKSFLGVLSVNEKSHITDHTLAQSEEFKQLATQQALQEKNAFSNL